MSHPIADVYCAPKLMPRCSTPYKESAKISYTVGHYCCARSQSPLRGYQDIGRVPNSKNQTARLPLRSLSVNYARFSLRSGEADLLFFFKELPGLEGLLAVFCQTGLGWIRSPYKTLKRRGY